MGSRIALVLRLLAALAVGATVLVVAEPATALTVPETLADRRPVQAGPVESSFPIDVVGVIWDVDHNHAHDHDHDAHTEEHGAVRFRTDGVWGPWIALVEDGAAAEGQWASALVDGGDADAYQVRGIPAEAGSPRAVAINTTDGPAVKVGERRADAAGALASSMCRSRADWGAEESLRFTKRGPNVTETWPPEHYPVQVLSVHHTATENGETGADAEARVRSIYQYHAIDRGWGDIGYQYLIDAAGVVYEGRWSGDTSTPCTSGGTGADFGHEKATDGDGDGQLDEMVTGAHIGGWNSGNMGVSLLGHFTSVAPTTAAVDGLETLLAELGTRHGLDPEGTVAYVNPVNGDAKTVQTISAHRDWEATECPGELLWAQLPDIRTAVAAAMAGGDTGTTDAPPTVAITAPAAGATVSGSTTVTADATDDNSVARVDFTAAGAAIGTDSDGTTGWSTSWDTTTSANGTITVAAVATDSAGQQTTHSITVTVENPIEPLSVTDVGPDPIPSGSTLVTITGTGFLAGATVTFANGKGSTPTAEPTTVESSTTLTTTVTVDGKGPSGTWDVIVTLTDGRNAVCSACASLQR